MDVTATTFINAEPRDVAAVMFNPSRDPEWIGGAERVATASGDPTAIGAKITRNGGFLGRKFSWTTEVAEFAPDRLLDMIFVAGPMKGGGVTYRIEPEGDGSRVSIRNRGPGPRLMGWFVRRSVAKDLERLKTIIGD